MRSVEFLPMDDGDLPEHADTVVVGGGLAGLELARELHEAGAADTLVLEAGPGDDLAHINEENDPDRALALWLAEGEDPHTWRPWSSETTPHYGNLSGLRRRLGGRSLYWHGVLLPIEEWALGNGNWPAQVVEDLTVSWRGGPCLYDRVRADVAAWIGDESAPETRLSELSLGKWAFSPTPQAVRGNSWDNGQRWGAYSPAQRWPEKGDQTEGPGVRFRTGVEVRRVHVTGGRVASVAVRTQDGVEREVSCRRVVLAAGTIVNTDLAIRAMRAAGHMEKDTLEGLCDHITQGFVLFAAPERVPGYLREMADKDSFYVAPFDNEGRERSNLFLRVYRNSAGAVVFDAWAMGEQLPGPAGTVRCEDGSEGGTVVRASLGPADKEVAEEQRSQLSAFWNELAAVCGLTGKLLSFPDFDAPDSTLETLLPGLDGTPASPEPVTWSGPLGSEYHEGGTLPLGRLLGQDHGFPGVEGLFAAGPCVFPRMGAANPSLTSLALSKRLAGLLMEQDS